MKLKLFITCTFPPSMLDSSTQHNFVLLLNDLQAKVNDTEEDNKEGKARVAHSGSATSVSTTFFFFRIARCPSGLEHRTGDLLVLGSNPAGAASRQNFGNAAYSTLPVSFGVDTKFRQSLLSGVYANGSK